MPRLQFLVGGFAAGGTERHLSLVLPRLKAKGWDVGVWMLSEDGPMSRPLREAEIDISLLRVDSSVALPKLRGAVDLWQRTRLVAAALRSRPPALLHCFLPEPTIVGWLAASAAGFRPVVVSKRSQMIRPAAFIGDKWLERRALRQADRVLAHSEAVMAELAAAGVARERLALIHNGVELEPFAAAAPRAATRAREGWPSAAVVIVCLANLIPYKGHRELLRALAGAAARVAPGAHRDWRLVCLGGGAPAYLDELRRLAAALGLAERVVFRGPTDGVADLLSAADIGVLASRHEGLPNALLECMAAGLPIVATSVGGNRDVVEDGRTGILIPPDDAAGLGTALMRLIADGERRRAMGKAGRARVAERFAIDGCVAAYDRFYRVLLAGKPPVPAR